MNDKDRLEQDAARGFVQQEELARTIGMGMHGNVPQIKRHERGQLLGQFRERVLWGLTQGTTNSAVVMESFRSALENPHANKLLVRSDFITQAMPYIKEAQKRNVMFTFVQSPEFTGNVSMVLAADQAVDVSEAIKE